MIELKKEINSLLAVLRKNQVQDINNDEVLMWDKKIVDPQQRILTLLIICISYLSLYYTLHHYRYFELGYRPRHLWFSRDNSRLVIAFILNIKQKTGLANYSSLLSFCYLDKTLFFHHVYNFHSRFSLIFGPLSFIYLFFYTPESRTVYRHWSYSWNFFFILYMQLVNPIFLIKCMLHFTEIILSPLVYCLLFHSSPIISAVTRWIISRRSGIQPRIRFPSWILWQIYFCCLTGRQYKDDKQGRCGKFLISPGWD